MNLYYGREVCDPAFDGPISSCHTDAQVARHLPPEPTGPWRKERVKKRRQRALVKLETCLSEGAEEGRA